MPTETQGLRKSQRHYRAGNLSLNNRFAVKAVMLVEMNRIELATEGCSIYTRISFKTRHPQKYAYLKTAIAPDFDFWLKTSMSIDVASDPSGFEVQLGGN